MTCTSAVSAKLLIFDLSGRMEGKVFEGRLGQGIHELKWGSAPGLKPGLYFFRLISSEGNTTGKFIIL